MNSISKEVVENDSLDQSGDTGFGSDDNVGEKVSKPEAELSPSGDDDLANMSVDDIDCLLLSSPMKAAPELVLNPLNHLGSSTTSEDSNSSSDVKSISSMESLTLKVSSSEDSSSSYDPMSSDDDDLRIDNISTAEKDCNPEDVLISIFEANDMKVKEDKGKVMDTSENEPCNNESST